MRDRIRAAVRDPIMASALVAGALVVAGFAAMVLAWRGAAATLDVPVQVPYLVSGGIGGLALLIAAASAALFSVVFGATMSEAAGPGLVAAYSFDEGSGTAVADASGTGNDGRIGWPNSKSLGSQ